MPVKESNMTVEAAPENAPFNYTLRDHRGKTIARVNWVTVGGLAVYPEMEMEISGGIVIDWVNEVWNTDDELDCEGAVIKVDSQ